MKKFIFLLGLMLSIGSSLQSQTIINFEEQDLKKTPIDSLNFDEIRLSKILNKAGEDLFMLNKLIESNADTTAVQDLNQRRKEHIDAYQDFSKSKFTKDLSNFSNRELENVNRQWNNQKNEIESVIDDYLVVMDRLEREKKALKTVDRFWKTFLKRTERNNTVLLDGIKSINKQITFLLPLYENKIEIITSNVNSLNTIDIQINDRLERINDHLSSTNKLFEQNAKPYWSSFNKVNLSDLSDSFINTLKDILFDLKETSRNFISTHILILFVLLFYYFVNVRIRTRLQTQSNYVETHSLKLNTVFKRPLRAAYFFTFIFAYYTYISSVPEIFLDVLSFIAVFVLFFIARNMFDKVVLNFIKHFIIFFIAVKIVDIFNAPSIISRTILLLSSIFFLFWLFRFEEKKKLEKYIRNTVIAQKILNYYFKLVGVMMVISVICTLFGYMNLALYTSAIVAKVTLLVAFLYVWNPSLKRFFELFIEEKFFKSRKFIYSNKEAILSTVFKVTNVLTYGVFIYSFLTITSLLKPFSIWFDATINNEISIGSFTFSLWSIILFVLIIVISTFLSRIIQLFLKDEVLVKADLGRGFPETISMLVKYLVVGIGYFIAITSLGFEMSQLTIIFGALSVGIGFGLQNIFNNLVSGFILIFSRPIRIDDTIEINNMMGTVKSIGVRSSNVRTLDGAEVVIPNGNLISNEVINWTLSDQRRRIEIMIGVAYGSDIELVSKLLKTILLENKQVMNTPDPLILFDEFADSSLNFKLLFWTENLGDWIKVKSAVLFEINKVFTKENIEIPFPQRDVHMRS